MMLKGLSRPFAALLLVCLAAVQANARVRTFLLAGQSNMLGYAEASQARPPVSPASVFVWNAIGGKVWSWSPLAPGFGKDTGCFGPELTLGEALSEAFPGDSIGFVKVSMGATSLAMEWHPPSAGGSGWLYDHMLNSLGWAAGQWPEGDMPAIQGVFWMQGESDAFTSADAGNYQGLLTHLIQDVRAHRGDDSLPWVVGLIDRQPAWPFADAVRMAQRQVSWTLPGVGLVETRGLATDGVHYTAEGQLELGRRMARRWLVMQGFMPDTLAPIAPFDSALVDTTHVSDSTGTDSVLVDTTHVSDSTGTDSVLVDTTHVSDSTGTDSVLVDTTHVPDSTGTDSVLVDTTKEYSSGTDSSGDSRIPVSVAWRAFLQEMPPGTRIEVRDAQGGIHARWVHGGSGVPPLLRGRSVLVVATLPNGRVEIRRRPPDWRR